MISSNCTSCCMIRSFYFAFLRLVHGGRVGWCSALPVPDVPKKTFGRREFLPPNSYRLWSFHCSFHTFRTLRGVFTEECPFDCLQASPFSFDRAFS
jgi:hypothetical protein